jgi:DNA (cytosine-5)-methyltransferase 1
MASAPPDKIAAEFFAGIGLMRIGLERAGWRVVFANDMRKYLDGREGCGLN